MAKAFNGKPAKVLETPACIGGSRSHISNVRTSSEHFATPEIKSAGEAGSACKTLNNKMSGEGGDRIDPRLFYFRALLDSGRFFGGETSAANRK